MTHQVTKTQVRNDFTYVRRLMSIANKMMVEGITDYSEAGEAGQVALELIASAGMFLAYLDERQPVREGN